MESGRYNASANLTLGAKCADVSLHDPLGP
jgi:hypothetical protein